MDTSSNDQVDQSERLLSSDNDEEERNSRSNPEQNEQSEDESKPLQKINNLSSYVSFKEDLEQTRVRVWTRLKEKMCSVMLSQGLDLQEWIYTLEEYINAFEFAFTKQEHILLVEMCWTVLMQIEHDFDLMNKLVNLTTLLLSKPSLLTREDLQLDWRPLNSLFQRLFYSSPSTNMLACVPSTMNKNLRKLAHKSSFYYSKESTSEILTEWRHLLSPYSSKYSQYIGLIALFVPVHLPPEEHALGFKLWLDDLMKIFVELPKQDHTVLVKMFSGLAKSAFGFIDWEPYMVVIFQYIQSKFISKTVSNDLITDAVRWIVYMITPTSSSCLTNLEQLLQIFFAKQKKIVCSLMNEFIGRLRTEMSVDKHWYECWTPQSCYLTSDLISQFNRLMVKHFEKIKFCDFELDHLYNLCLIAPAELAQQSVDKFALAEARIFEPNRLKLALQMYSVSLFPLVADELVGPKHRTTVISTLIKLTKSINTNDQTIAFLHLLTIRSIVVLGMPLEDCSHLNTDGLDEHSIQIMKDSNQLERFPSDFVQLCFTILECNNDRLFNMTKQGLTLNSALFDILLHVLTNVSQEKCATICDQIVSYCTTSIIESAQCCDLLEQLLIACLHTDHSGQVFSKLFISISSNLLSSMEDHTKYSEICQSEFIYNWRMLHVCFGFNGKVLVPHQDAIVRLLKRIYKIEFDANFEHNNMITEILSYLFYILTSIYSLSRVYNGRLSEDDNKLKQLTQFPVQYTLAQLPLEWHVPNEDEIAFAKNLFVQFIKPEMSSLEEWANGHNLLTSAQLEKNLGIVLSFLGCRQCLPSAGDSIIQNYSYFSDLSDSFAIDLFDGENFRENLILLMGKILKKLKTSPSENVALIKMIVEAIDHSLFPYSISTSTGTVRTKRTKGRANKNVYHPLTSRYTSLPIVKYNKVSEYHSKMSTILKRWTNHKFTNCHQVATFQLLDLSTCSNTILRDRAQRILCKLINLFRSKVVELIFPRLLENLRNVSQHDVFIGTLDLLTNRATFESILIASEWTQLAQLWPTLVEVNRAEKPKIVNLIDSNVMNLFKDGVYVTMPIQKKLLCPIIEKFVPKANELNFNVPSSEEIEQIERSIEAKVKTDRIAYEDLVNRLTALLAPKTLHWRFYKLGFIMLQYLIQYDYPDYPLETVKFTLENVIHDLDSIRQLSLWGLKKILLFIKPTKVLYRGENFDPNSLMDCLESREIYERAQFNDKTDYGFSDEIALVCSKFVSKNERSKYQFIADKFCDETFLDQFFKLHSVENLKRLTRNVNLTKMFKHLFGTFGLINSGAFFVQIKTLLQKKKHNYDKCALEILWAMVRSAPRLDYDQLVTLKHFLNSILFDKYFATKCYTSDSFEYWYCLFIAMFTHRDLRRFYWVFERFFNERLFDESRSTFNQATVFGLIGIGLDANWKYEHVNEMVLNRLEQNMAQKYEILRTIMSLNIIKVFHYRIQLPSPSTTSEFVILSKPSRIDFIQRMYDRLYLILSPLLEPSCRDQTSSNRITHIKSTIFNFDTEAGRELYNLIDTICTWTRHSLADSRLIAPGEFGMLFPLLSVVQTNKPELQVNVHQAITSINTQKYSQPRDVDSILPLLDLVSHNWNWHSRKLVTTFVHNMLYNNLFIVQSTAELIDKLSSLILRMLSDEAIEVRNTAMIVVKDLIKWNVICEEKMIDLVIQWKTNALDNVNKNLVERHGAILGLCAFAYAYSYEMNSNLVDIVLFLAKRLSDPEPIHKTISQALRSFKTTHESNWIEHKKQFTDEQLTELSNTLVSLSCFA